MYKLEYHLYSIFIFIFFSCKERDQYAKGCQMVSPSPFQMGLATTLDPARDLQRLNTLIISNLDDLKSFTEPNSVYSKEITSSEDLLQLSKNVMAMIDAAVKLQQIHLTYRSLIDRELKYGSRQAPIGDDNYLHLRGGSATLPTLNHQKHHNLGLDKSPNFFIRHEMLRSSLTNDKLSHYWHFVSIVRVKMACCLEWIWNFLLFLWMLLTQIIFERRRWFEVDKAKSS